MSYKFRQGGGTFRSSSMVERLPVKFRSSQGKPWDELLGITVKPFWGNTVGIPQNC